MPDPTTPWAGIRAWHVVLATTAGAVVGFLSAPRNSAWQVVAYFVPLALAVGCIAARTVGTPAGRGPLSILLAAQAGYFVTSLFWYPVPLVTGVVLPFPSLVDASYLTVYAAYAVFLVMVLRGRARDRAEESRIALTDALILSTSMSALLWLAVVHPTLRGGTASLATLVAVAYPAATLLLFVLAARLAVGSQLRASGPGLLLLAWIAVEITGDTIYGLQGASGTFVMGAPLFVTWMVSAGCLAAMAAHPEVVRLFAAEPGSAATRTPRRNGAARQVLLLCAALLTVVLSHVSPERSTVLLVATVVTVSLVIYRTSLLAGDLDRERALAVQLEGAVAHLHTQRELLEQQAADLERLAFHDSVTGLGNRALLRRAEDSDGSTADATLLLLDLDGFKQVNDSLGHAAGDAVLLEVGDRLGRCVRTVDTVVRLGGDEFAVLLRGAGRTTAMRIAERVLREVRAPIRLEGTTVEVRCSIGVAPGATAAGLDEMIRNADLAMYAAKDEGRDRVREFDPSMYLEAIRRLDLDAQVRRALADGELTVHYQPIVETTTGAPVAVEALVRWEHPERGLLPPAEFLAAAERTGMIVDLGRLVLRTACRDAARWREEWPHVGLSVNVSHQELLIPGFAEHIVGVLAEHALPPAALHLEITETVLADEESVRRALEPLDRLGVRLSIDDFGTGYSSLSRLRALTVHRLKIDRSFVAEIGECDPPEAPMLASIVSLAHSVGLKVVAEGVETERQAVFLAEHRCDELQGYLFSRPVPAGDVPAALRASVLPQVSRSRHG
ncbi:putative bifunctional diguanylate cyclase/phosphodiesterase [Oryzobacter sp. R7]|uniref:putative bifunctional diguanylate cyclase/phosphodiesterase n=1 Tax=Oryzobacter faecalis TaxID=3388656 RepID=UPI00398C9A7A